MTFWDAVESLQRTFPIWDTQAINHSILCHFMLNLVQKQFQTHKKSPIPWSYYIQQYKRKQLSLQPFIMSVIGCVENGSLHPQELQNLKNTLASTPLDKREFALLSCIKNNSVNIHFIADSIIANQLEILPVLFVLSPFSASLILRQLHESGAPLPVYDILDKYQRLCYFALFQKIGLNWSQQQTPLFQTWIKNIKHEDKTLSRSCLKLNSFDQLFHHHAPIKTQGRCIFVEYQGRQIIMKIRYKHESSHRFIGSAVLSEGRKTDRTGLFKRCNQIHKVTLSENLRQQCEQMIRKNSEGMENVELSNEASVFESENYFSYIDETHDEKTFWDAIENNIHEYSQYIFQGRLFHRFLGLNHDILRPVHYAIFLSFISYYTHNLGSYKNPSSGVRWPNFGLYGGRDADNIYHIEDCMPSLSPFYTECLRHIGIKPQKLFEDIAPLSCLMELMGSIEILLLNWYRQHPHLLSQLTPDEFSNKMITKVYRIVLEKLWKRPLNQTEINTIKHILSPLIESDFKTFQKTPDIIDSSLMPFRCRDFPLQNLVLSRIYVIHLAFAYPEGIPPHPPRHSPPYQPQKTKQALHERWLPIPTMD